jgi:hypothetical protein
MNRKHNAARSLPTIVAAIRKTFRNDIANIIRRGELLQEAKDQLDHGQWLPWLEDNFSMEERTAQRAMAVAKFAAKYDNLSDLRLKKSALYDLSSGVYPENVINAALKEAKTKLINEFRIEEINDELNPPPEPEPVEDIPETGDADYKRWLDGLEAERKQRLNDLNAGAEKILDGPPPELPPTADPAAPTDFTLAQFDKAVKALAELHTKSVSKFVDTGHSTDDLEKMADFLRAVASAVKKRRDDGPLTFIKATAA